MGNPLCFLIWERWKYLQFVQSSFFPRPLKELFIFWDISVNVTIIFSSLLDICQVQTNHTFWNIGDLGFPWSRKWPVRVWQFSESFACPLSKYRSKGNNCLVQKNDISMSGWRSRFKRQFLLSLYKCKVHVYFTLVFGMHVCLNRCIRVSETK